MDRLRQITLLRITLLLLGLLLLAQLGGLLLRDGEATAQDAQQTGEAAITVRGVVIRQETALSDPGDGHWVRQAENGARVAAGQVLYTLGDAEQPKAATALPKTLPARRQAIHDAIAQWDARRDGSGPDPILRLLLLAESGTVAEPALEPKPLTAATVRAETSGLFTSASDGLEAILTPEEPWTPIPLPTLSAGGSAPGRIVTGDRWYFRTELPFSPEDGGRIEAALLGGLGREVTLRTEAVRPKGDTFEVLFSCGEALESVVSLRYLAVELRP